MVGCDTRCDASCSCTSVIYSDILSTDGSALSVRKDSPICTCPHSTRRPPPDTPLKTTMCRPPPDAQLKTTCRPKPASPLQTPPNRPPSDRPLHATTCLPQPLPVTPRREETPREPDYLRLERTLISPGRIGPFEIPDPQPIYTARKFQLHKGETFNVAVDYLTRLRRYRKCAAEWAFPRDVANTPFFSVLFLHSAKQNPLAAPVEEPPSVVLVENQPAVISKPVVEENIPKSIATTSDLSVCSSNKWGSVYKAMGSASEASSGSQQTDSAERLVRIWQDDFAGKSWGTGSTSELTTDAGVFDSGDVTLPITTPRMEEKSQTRREDFGQWYRALDQMDRLMGETAASVSNSSCSTAKTISLHRSTTLSSASCPLVTTPTVTEPHPPVDTVHHPRKKTIYCRIRKFFRGGPAHQQ